MKPNDYIITTANHSNNRRLLTSGSSGIFAKEVVRTSNTYARCSRSASLKLRIAKRRIQCEVITPVASGKQADAMTSDTYQSARGPGFDEYLAG
jgi:hypothetical protein